VWPSLVSLVRSMALKPSSPVFRRAAGVAGDLTRLLAIFVRGAST